MAVVFQALMALSRPGNMIITALSVAIGGHLAGGGRAFTQGKLWLAALAAALIAAGGNAYNDYCDRELDRAQKPDRPLPSGRITPRSARIWAGLCLIIGIFLSLALGMICARIALLAVLALLLYSRFLKGAPLWGNLLVALIAAMAFVYGAAAVGDYRLALWAAWLAFLYHLGREIIKDMEDLPGDAAAGARTLPVRFGLSAGRWSASLVLLLLLVSLPFPYLLSRYSAGYLWLALLGVLPLVLAVVILQWFWSQPAQFHRLSIWLKWDMLVGLAALLIGHPHSRQGI